MLKTLYIEPNKEAFGEEMKELFKETIEKSKVKERYGKKLV